MFIENEIVACFKRGELDVSLGVIDKKYIRKRRIANLEDDSYVLKIRVKKTKTDHDILFNEIFASTSLYSYSIVRQVMMNIDETLEREVYINLEKHLLATVRVEVKKTDNAISINELTDMSHSVKNTVIRKLDRLLNGNEKMIRPKNMLDDLSYPSTSRSSNPYQPDGNIDQPSQHGSTDEKPSQPGGICSQCGNATGTREAQPNISDDLPGLSNTDVELDKSENADEDDTKIPDWEFDETEDEDQIPSVLMKFFVKFPQRRMKLSRLKTVLMSYGIKSCFHVNDREKLKKMERPKRRTREEIENERQRGTSTDSTEENTCNYCGELVSSGWPLHHHLEKHAKSGEIYLIQCSAIECRQKKTYLNNKEASVMNHYRRHKIGPKSIALEDAKRMVELVNKKNAALISGNKKSKPVLECVMSETFRITKIMTKKRKKISCVDNNSEDSTNKNRCLSETSDDHSSSSDESPPPRRNKRCC